MNLIKSDLQNMLPAISWDVFEQQGDVYVTKYIPEFDDEETHDTVYRLRSKYPSEYAAALLTVLPEDAKLVSYDHLSLKLTVTRA